MICILAVVLLFGSSAWATYPGQNGRIAFVGSFTGTWQLYTINPDGSDLFQVTDLPATEFPVWSPNYSPDGQRIAFCHDMTGAIELYVINVDGTGLTQITNDGAENLFPQWSPDGTRILFSAFCREPHYILLYLPLTPSVRSSVGVNTSFTFFVSHV